MKLSKLVIAIFAMSAAGAMANSNKSSHTSQSMDQSSKATTASADGSSLMQGNNISQAQQALNDKGFAAGNVDGKWGPQTEAAVKKFQAAQKLDQTGQLDQQTLAALGVGSGNIAQAPSSSMPSDTSSQASGTNGSSSLQSQASGTNGSSSMSGTNGSSAASGTNGSTSLSGTNGSTSSSTSGTNGSNAMSGTNGSTK